MWPQKWENQGKSSMETAAIVGDEGLQLRPICAHRSVGPVKGAKLLKSNV